MPAKITGLSIEACAAWAALIALARATTASPANCRFLSSRSSASSSSRGSPSTSQPRLAEPRPKSAGIESGIVIVCFTAGSLGVMGGARDHARSVETVDRHSRVAALGLEVPHPAARFIETSRSVRQLAHITNLSLRARGEQAWAVPAKQCRRRGRQGDEEGRDGRTARRRPGSSARFRALGLGWVVRVVCLGHERGVSGVWCNIG